MGGQQAAAGTPFTPAADGAAFTRKLATGGPSRFTARGRFSIQAGRSNARGCFTAHTLEFTRCREVR